MKFFFPGIVLPLVVCLLDLIITSPIKAQTPTDTESTQQEQLTSPDSFRTSATPTIDIESKTDSTPQLLETIQEGTVHRDHSETSSAESSGTPAPAIPPQTGDTPDTQVNGMTLTHRDEPDKATSRTRNLHGSGSSTAQNNTPAKVEPAKTASAEQAIIPSSPQTQSTVRSVPWLGLAAISAIGLLALRPIVWIISSIVGTALGIAALFLGQWTWQHTLPIALGLSYVSSTYPFLRAMAREAPIGLIAFGSLLGIPTGVFAHEYLEMDRLGIAMCVLAVASLAPKAVLRIFMETGLIKIEKLRSPSTQIERSLSPGHPDVARNLNNLASLLKATNQLAEAEMLSHLALRHQVNKSSLRSDSPRSSASSPISSR